MGCDGKRPTTTAIANVLCGRIFSLYAYLSNTFAVEGGRRLLQAENPYHRRGCRRRGSLDRAFYGYCSASCWAHGKSSSYRTAEDNVRAFEISLATSGPKQCDGREFRPIRFGLGALGSIQKRLWLQCIEESRC